jgi:hypothetical protein
MAFSSDICSDLLGKRTEKRKAFLNYHVLVHDFALLCRKGLLINDEVSFINFGMDWRVDRRKIYWGSRVVGALKITSNVT